MAFTPRRGLLCALALAAAGRVFAAGAADPMAPCLNRFAQQPDDYDSAYCFYRLTLDGHSWQASARQLEALMADHPGNFWLPLAYGHMYRARDPVRTETLYRQAANGFKSLGHAEGEIVARSNLRSFVFPHGRVDDAAREVARVVEIAEASDDPLLKARAWSLQAQHLEETGGNLGHAFRLLKQAEAAIFPNGPYRMKRTNLDMLGIVAVGAGRFDEALAAFHRLDELAGAERDLRTQAFARYNIFHTTSMKEALLPTAGGRERLVSLVQRALAAGQAAGEELVVIRSHAALAEILGNTPGGRTSAFTHLHACLALARKAQQAYDEAVCSWIEAWLVQSVDPQRAAAAESRAFAATERARNPRTDATSAGRHMRLSWSTKSRPDAIRESLAAIDAVETLRALQDDHESSAGLFSMWTLDYYWLSGRLLQEGRDGDVPLAFSITERMRARWLLDLLDRSRVPPDPRHPAVREHRSALEAIAIAQRALMNPMIDDASRRTNLLALEVLERKEQEAQRQVGLTSSGTHRARPVFATLDEVQSALANDEALLSFQVGLWETFEGHFGGGSWLVAITRTQRTVHRLPDRVQLSGVVPMFTGLIEAGHGREGVAAARLHRELLADALAALPSQVKRLVIVADGALHRLPFEALRATSDAPPLGARYQLTVAPSVTLWLQWRGAAGRTSPRRILTLADPALDDGDETAARTRASVLFQGLRLGRLPHARQESRAIARHVGTADALVGAAASEEALKATDLRRYGVLHLAAHAVADEVKPERSAIVLAPGDANEDGLLQSREIHALALDGGVVVLSACYTAGGAVLSGEGVLSLARAFFAAGAHAVVGSRWPLRDSDAAELFEGFYRRLGRGASLAEALQATQNEARAAGRPASTWAALVLLGNGDLRPFAGTRVTVNRSHLAIVFTIGLTLLLALGVVGIRRLR
jgi:tetratricopeptide (TPR) repeat protein